MDILEYLKYEDKIFICILVEIVVLIINFYWYIISVDINCLGYWSWIVMLCWIKSIGVCNIDGFLLIDKFGVFGISKCLVYIFDFIILEWISFKKDGGNFIKGY